jgi:phage recombination protein Bet
MGSEVLRPPEAQVAFSQDQIELLKNTVCKGATDDEFALFLQVCKKKRLDPFSKQIYAIKRWDKKLNREVMTFQTGIDGFRVLAERTGLYAGQEAPMWCGADGKWRDVWLDAKPPMAAKIGILRKDFQQPVVRVALYREYAQPSSSEPNSMWSKMPANQLSKCCEALALRAAFPEELSGLYAQEEMDSTDNPESEPPKKRPPIAVRKPAPTKQLSEPEALDVAPEPPAEDTATFRMPSEQDLRNGLVQGLETLPVIKQAWTDLQQDFERAGCEATLEQIRKRFIEPKRTPDGKYPPLALRTAIVVARNWRDDHLELWLQPGTAAETE